MATILIVEDDRVLNQGLAYALGGSGHEAVSAYSYEEGLAAFHSYRPDLILLDVHLPDRAGTELCERIRQQSDTPVIFLTADDTEADMVLGFKLGADDYMAKPFSMAVLHERVKAVLRRRGGEEGGGQPIVCKELTVHLAKRKVFKRGEELKLSAGEFKLLEALLQNRSRVMTREAILERLWDLDGSFVDENTLSVNIKRLRNKIEDDPKHPVYVKTVFGIGYTWGD
ncbi:MULTISPECIES: response regulator transcription factor [unclassified Paenibacillus]|uniref:response regulator transcription factor n=1 Tax=unclassified Paenibacillus TaxID=185978 RepID=UPI000954955F|nr:MULTISPECIES: response regulator transcription factor [unclassified Paenibacillus]ASS68342.1 response regulator transcription factor [Paenibacillus sp. RUD330]SIR29669.1 DNA-binding response regulator, OmpR family, contains REC and winged-helix (wHTH) domain [Paenibacillus sp. RU4X]SIR41698.1 DNA-binding response regulator, OmpR family, contains REC and winged-helix (wHTH) domain [Paenibacillus sp. RU4T]